MGSAATKLLGGIIKNFWSMQQVRTSLYVNGLLYLSMTLLVLIGVSIIIVQQDLDRRWTAKLFSPTEGWLLLDRQPWQWLYAYGTIPGLLFTITAIVILCLTYLKSKLSPWRSYLLVLVLTPILGAGLLVNAIFKDHWGRPRPRQVEEFGGKWEYRHVHQPGIPGKGKSFPCGHCAISYVFVSTMVLYRKSRWIALTSTGFGLFYGTLMSLARVGQGAHFPSDALWALGINVLLSILLFCFIFPHSQSWLPQKILPDKKRRIGMTFVLLFVLAVMIFIFLTRRPKFEDHKYKLPLDVMVRQVKLQTNVDRKNFSTYFLDEEHGFIQTVIQGFGGPTSFHEFKIQGIKQTDGTLFIDYHLQANGYFSERNVELSLYLPIRFKGKVLIIP